MIVCSGFEPFATLSASDYYLRNWDVEAISQIDANATPLSVRSRRIALTNPFSRRPRLASSTAVGKAKVSLCASCGEDRPRMRDELRQFPEILGGGG